MTIKHSMKWLVLALLACNAAEENNTGNDALANQLKKQTFQVSSKADSIL